MRRDDGVGDRAEGSRADGLRALEQSRGTHHVTRLEPSRGLEQRGEPEVAGMRDCRGKALVLAREPFQLRGVTEREEMFRAGEQRIETA